MAGRAAAADAPAGAKGRRSSRQAGLQRRAATIAAVLLLAMAIVVVAVVIPPVSGDSHPTTNRDASIVAFAVHSLAAVAAAGLLLGSATTLRARRWPVVAMVLALVLALALLDAAAEFRQHGRDLRVATWAMWLGAALELGAAALAGVAAFADLGRRFRR